MKIITPLDPVAVIQLGDSRRWRVVDPWECFLEIDGALHQITIPSGFTFDRASVPNLAGILITRDSLGCPGPLVHDALYRCEGRPLAIKCDEPSCIPWRIFSRSEADNIFHALMLADGVNPWRARVAWIAVRVFAKRWG